MEGNIIITNYITKLTRSNLIEYLAEKKVDTKVVHILKSRDIDGEIFLNFTELDLIQWGLKENQKRDLLNCRNQLISKTTPTMPAKPIVTKNIGPVTKGVTQSKSFKIENKKTATQVRAQPLSRSLSSEEIHDMPITLPAQSNHASVHHYMDMNQTKGTSIENKQYYAHASQKPEPIRCPIGSKGFTRPLFTIPKPSNTLSDTSRNNLEIFVNPRPPLHPNAGVRRKTNLKQSIQETPLTSFEATRSSQTSSILKGEEYLRPTTAAPYLNYSAYEDQYEYVNELRYSSTQTKNRIQEQIRSGPPTLPLPISRNASSGHTSDEDERFYEEEPSLNRNVLLNHSDFKKNQQTTLTVTPDKVSIQNCPLPPIPKQNKTEKQRDVTWPALPPTPKEFGILKANEKPKIMPRPIPKPVKEKNSEKFTNCDEEITSDFNIDLDFDSFPPPPPEFLNSPENEDIAERTETTWNVFDSSLLPRPPVLTGVFEPYQIKQFKEMLSPVRTPTSDDEDSCNPNNLAYYRNTDRKGAMQLIEKLSNLENGTFLLRPSNNVSYDLGLTVFQDNHYYNVGIKKDCCGQYYCERFSERGIVKFETLNALVEYYTDNSLAVKSKKGRVAKLYLKHPLPDYVF